GVEVGAVGELDPRMKLEGPLRLVRRGGPRIREIRDDLECLRLVRHETLENLLGDLKRVAVGHVPRIERRGVAALTVTERPALPGGCRRRRSGARLLRRAGAQD